MKQIPLMRPFHLIGLTIVFAAILFAPVAHAATLGDAANKTTLGNDIIGGSKFIYSLGGISISTTTTSTGAIILGTGGLRFSDGSTQITSAQTTANFWSLSGVNLYPTSTAYKVAIGSTVATSSLTVTGDAILYGASGNISAGIYYDRTNTAYYLDPGANENAYSLTAAGNVGIGTTTPARNLHISGSGTVGVRFTHTGGPSTQDVLYTTGADANGLRLLIGSGGPVIIGGGESAGAINTNVAVGSEALFLASDNTGTTEAIRFVTGVQSGWASRVDAVSIRGDGNVGIGTTNPGYKLDISGTANINNKFYFWNGATAASPAISFNNDADTGIYNPDNNDQIGLSTAGLERIRIDSTGNVGIATTTPSDELTVFGDVRISKSGSTLIFPDGTTQSTAAAGGGGGGYWALSGNNLYPTSTSYKAVIGGSVATSSLTVIGDATLYGASGNISAGVYYDRTNTAYYLDPGANENAYSLTTAGSVGVGATAPAARLHVSDAYSAPTGGLDANIDLLVSNTGSWTGVQLLGSNSSGAFIDFGDTDDANVGQILYSHASNYFAFKTAAAERVRIDSSGNVGIATTTPNHKLSIDGAYYSKMVQRGNVSGSVTIDWNSGNTQHLILTGNITTLTLNNGQSGGRYTLVIKQGGTGNYEITWPASTRFSGPNPSLSNAVGDTDYIGFIYNGVDAIYDGVAVNLGF